MESADNFAPINCASAAAHFVRLSRWGFVNAKRYVKLDKTKAIIKWVDVGIAVFPLFPVQILRRFAQVLAGHFVNERVDMSHF